MSLAQTTSPPTVWDRVVCGIDFTAASLHAALLVARLMPASAELTLCAVADVDFSPEAIESGLGLFLVDKTIMRKAKDALTEVQTEVQAIHDADPHMREGAPMPGLLDELSSLATASGASPAAARRQRAGAVGVREDGEVVQAGARDGVQAAAAFGLPRGCRSPRRESAMRVLLPGPHTFRSGGAPVGDHAPVGEVGLELEHLLSGAALRAVG